MRCGSVGGLKSVILFPIWQLCREPNTYMLVNLLACFFVSIPRLYLSGKFSFVVTARLDTRIEWFLFTKCMLTWLPLSAPLQ
jgi:hypothetical protein